MSPPALRKVILPELGLGETPLRVSRWLAPLGGTVIVEDPLVEVLSDGFPSRFLPRPPASCDPNSSPPALSFTLAIHLV